MRCLLLGLLLIVFIVPGFAQQTNTDSSQANSDSIVADWSFEVDAYYYILPEEKNTTTLIAYADYRALHMEARYNYEDVNTGSLFLGYGFEMGNKLVLNLTPMIGCAFGNTNGIVPGLETGLSWKKFDFYSEMEYVIDLEGKENNYFYTWTELAITPFHHFRTGVSASRTRLYQTDFDLQRGVFAQYSFWKLTAGIHYFNPFTHDDFGIATLAIEF